MPMRYEDFRREEHSTLGDAADRFRRDPDAFTAGAQYALDHLTNDHEVLSVFGDGHIRTLVEDQAAAILKNIHDGRL